MKFFTLKAWVPFLMLYCVIKAIDLPKKAPEASLDTGATLIKAAQEIKQNAHKMEERARAAQSWLEVAQQQIIIAQAEYDIALGQQQEYMSNLSKASAAEALVIKNQLKNLNQSLFAFYQTRLDIPFIHQWNYVLGQKIAKLSTTADIINLYENEFKAIKEGKQSVIMPTVLYSFDYKTRQLPLLQLMVKKLGRMNTIGQRRKDSIASINARIIEIIRFKPAIALSGNIVDSTVPLANAIPSARLRLLSEYIPRVLKEGEGWFMTGYNEARRYLKAQITALNEVIQTYHLDKNSMQQALEKLENFSNDLQKPRFNSALIKELTLEQAIPFKQWTKLKDTLQSIMFNLNTQDLEALQQWLTTVKGLHLQYISSAHDFINFFDEVLKNYKPVTKQKASTIPADQSGRAALGKNSKKDK